MAIVCERILLGGLSFHLNELLRGRALKLVSRDQIAQARGLLDHNALFFSGGYRTTVLRNTGVYGKSGRTADHQSRQQAFIFQSRKSHKR
jgi:hypothetical protein